MTTKHNIKSASMNIKSTPMNIKSASMHDIAKAITEKGKGILAADESIGTIEKRFAPFNIENNENMRRKYRQMLFKTPDTLGTYIAGVILHEETIRQKTDEKINIPELIHQNHAIAGIKVDKGAHPLAACKGEKITEGLDGLRNRLQEFYKIGARFAKWRAVINIEDKKPTELCIKANAHALARYAALCQENNIVPIVEPEVLMDGENATHSIEQCQMATERVLHHVFQELINHHVKLNAIVLKPNMIISGKNAKKQACPNEIAQRTIETLQKYVPKDVPGIAFLSGGQSDIQATENLSLINKNKNLPWNCTFSYGRALQSQALKEWSGNPQNIQNAQRAFHHRAKMNALAAIGQWEENLEKIHIQEKQMA